MGFVSVRIYNTIIKGVAMDGYYDIIGIENHVVALLYYGIGKPRIVALFNKVTKEVKKISCSNYDNESLNKFVKYVGGKLCE